MEPNFKKLKSFSHYQWLQYDEKLLLNFIKHHQDFLVSAVVNFHVDILKYYDTNEAYTNSIHNFLKRAECVCYDAHYIARDTFVHVYTVF